MRITQATLLALSSSVLVSAAPIVGRRGLVATAEVLSCGSNDGGLTVHAGKTGNCPVGWGRPKYNDKICVEIEEHHSSTHKASATHKSSAHSTNKAAHSSAHKSTSTHKSHSTSSHHHSSHKSSSARKSSSTTHHRSSTTTRHTASPTPKPKTCPPGQEYNQILSLCLDIVVDGVASIGGGLKIGNPLAPGAKGPLASAGLGLDLGDVANLGGGLKLGGPGGGKPSTTSHKASSTSKANEAKATKSGKGECSDEDALLHLCLKVGNIVSTDTSVLGSKGLVDSGSSVLGVPVKATVAGKDGKLVDANVANGAVKASVGGKDKALVDADVGNGAVKATVGGKGGLVDAKAGNILQVSAGSDAKSGAHKQGDGIECPKGQILHLGVCVDVHATVLGVNADAVANVAL